MKKALFLSISFIIFFFFLGMFVGIYEFFPYSELASLKNQFETNSEIMSNNPSDTLNIDDLISIQNESDIFEKRNQLIQFTWNSNDLPSGLPDYVEQNISDERFSDLSNLKQIDKLTIEMESGLSSIVYIFSSEIDNNDVILYHQGHAGGFINGKNTIQKLLNSGFTVAAFSMPLSGMNNEPIINHEKFGTFKLNSHNHFEFLESENFHPLRFFLEPVVVTLNQIEKNFTFDSFAMIGISGGGWTTVLISAIDDRIDESYSVAGSFPIWLRFDSRDFGDYEQTIPEFYKIANYLELYVLSSYDDRSLILFYNEFDSCCFSGEVYNKAPFADSVKSKLSQFGENNFDVIIDYGQTEHIISDYTLDKINNYLQTES